MNLQPVKAKRILFPEADRSHQNRYGMKRILKRIAGLFKVDLEKDSAKYWKLSSYDARVQDYSHWCGSARWDEKKWIEYGESNIRFALEKIETVEGPGFLERARTGEALEWGCGGGSNILALYRHFPRVSGLEIAAPTIEECLRQARRRGIKNFNGILIDSGRPESVLKKIRRDSLDFIFSTAVFQHFPSKDYTARVLRVMNAILKCGAPAWIQIREFDGSPKLRQKEADYAANMIYMTSFTFAEFSEMVKDCGFILMWAGKDESDGKDDHAFYLIRKAFSLTNGSP